MSPRTFTSCQQGRLPITSPVTSPRMPAVPGTSVRRLFVAIMGGAMTFLVAVPASAAGPCDARDASQKAQLRANQADVDLANHMANKPKDADPEWENSRGQIDAKIKTLDSAVATAKQELKGATADLNRKLAEFTAANKKFNDITDQTTPLLNEQFKQRTMSESPAAVALRNYDTQFRKVADAIPCDDLRDARAKIRDTSFANFNDARIRKLRSDIDDLSQGRTVPNQAQKASLAAMQAELNTYLENLSQTIEAAETAKRDLVANHKFYPVSPEADTYRQNEAAVAQHASQRGALNQKLEAAKAYLKQVGREGTEIRITKTKAEDALSKAELAQKTGRDDLEKLRNTLDKKIGDSAGQLKAWTERRTALEQEQTDAYAEMKQTKEAYDAAVEAAKTYNSQVAKRWATFHSAVVAKFNETKTQIGETNDDEEKDKIRAAARPWFAKAGESIPGFLATLESSPHNGDCDECRGLRDLIAEVKKFGGTIDAIVATLDERTAQEAVDLSGAWACACGSEWAITKYGKNSAQGARYAVRITHGDWTANLAGSFNYKTKVLTVAGRDNSNPAHMITVQLTYDTHSGHLGGPYMDRSAPENNATEDVWRTQ